MANYPNYRIAVEIIILHEDQILLTKRAGQEGPGVWSVPAGKVKYEEIPIDALYREAKEETNLDVEFIQELDVRTFSFQMGEERVYRLGYTYLVKPRNNDVHLLALSDEHSEFVWVNKETVLSGEYRFEHENLQRLLISVLSK